MKKKKKIFVGCCWCKFNFYAILVAGGRPGKSHMFSRLLCAWAMQVFFGDADGENEVLLVEKSMKFPVAPPSRFSFVID